MARRESPPLLGFESSISMYTFVATTGHERS